MAHFPARSEPKFQNISNSLKASGIDPATRILISRSTSGAKPSPLLAITAGHPGCWKSAEALRNLHARVDVTGPCPTSGPFSKVLRSVRPDE